MKSKSQLSAVLREYDYVRTRADALDADIAAAEKTLNEALLAGNLKSAEKLSLTLSSLRVQRESSREVFGSLKVRMASAYNAAAEDADDETKERRAARKAVAKQLLEDEVLMKARELLSAISVLADRDYGALLAESVLKRRLEYPDAMKAAETLMPNAFDEVDESDIERAKGILNLGWQPAGRIRAPEGESQ